MSVKPQFAFPVRYLKGDCPGPECTYGVAKFCIYEVSVFGATKTKKVTKVVQLCSKCRKTSHIKDGRIVKGATSVREQNRVYLRGHNRYRDVRSHNRSISN